MYQISNIKVKGVKINKIEDYYKNNNLDKNDTYDITIDTSREDELLAYINIIKYHSQYD